jgi:hypothetical protein
MRPFQFFFFVSLFTLSSSTIARCGLDSMKSDITTSKRVDLDCIDACERLKDSKSSCPKFDSLLYKKCLDQFYTTLPEGCECPDEIKRREEEEKKRQANPSQYSTPTYR